MNRALTVTDPSRFMRCASVLIASALVAPALPAQTVTESASGVRALLQAVSPVSDRVIWVSGHNGTVLRSVDGGATWEVRPVTGAEATLQFRDIHALSADVAWALSAGPGDASRIYHTSDGGASWTLQFRNADPLAFYDCLTFFDAHTGVAYSDAVAGKTLILRTTDGGTLWNHLPASAVPAALEGEGAYAASGGCVTSVGPRNGWITLGGPGARFFRSTDAGATWQVHETPFVRGAAAGMTAAAFRDANNGIAVAAEIGAMANDSAAAAVGFTTNGGVTWTLGNRPKKLGALFGVAVLPAVDGQTAVTAGLGGLFVTRDNGQTWTAVDERAFWSVGASGRSAWGVGPTGRIVKVEF